MRILAVDDEEIALCALEKVIRSEASSAEIVCCSRFQQALDACQKLPFDMAFLDIEIGALGGLELARRLKEINPNMAIVFVTAYSKYAVDAFSLKATGYILKPVSSEDVARELKYAQTRQREDASSTESFSVKVNTFGNFEVLYGSEAVVFPRRKSKELLAYLIHKRGSSCSVRELAVVLFEDRPYTLSVQRQMQTIIAAMIKTLKSIGAENFIVKNYNSLAVDVQVVDCDYYRFLEGDPSAVAAYTGEYMANYSWAEFVVGYLSGQKK